MGPMVYVLFFLAAFLAVESLHMLLRERRGGTTATASRRLRRLADRLRAPESHAEQSILRRRRKASRLDALLQMLPRGEMLELQLYRAGLTITAPRFLTLSGALSIVGFFVAGILLEDPARGAAGLLLGVVPWIQVRRSASKRMHQFEQQLPDALEMLTRTLRAGHSLGFGLQMVGQEMPDPVGTELAQVSEEIKLGHDTRDALDSLAYRLGTPDLSFLVAAILIQRESGGNLAEVLENLAHVIRERLKLYSKVRSLTATARASANVLAIWPVLTIAGLQFVNPGYIAPLWDTHVGQMLLIVAGVLVAIGYVVCRRMSVVRV